MLINSSKLLKEARLQSKCIAAFNVYNLETIQAAFRAAKNKKAPIIIAFGEGYLPYTDINTIFAIVKSLDRNHDLPVVLHLDHCKNIELIIRAIDEGFTSIMYDGSMLPIDENIRNTKKVAAYAHAAGISAEGELGGMNPEDGSQISDKITLYTDPLEAKRYILETGIDSLAVSVGNAHGAYKGIPHLNFRRLEEVWDEVKIPLVLHGCSGIPDEQIKKAISLGVSKININTEIALAGAKRIKAILDADKQGNVRLEKLMHAAEDQMCQVMEKYISLAYGD